MPATAKAGSGQSQEPRVSYVGGRDPTTELSPLSPMTPISRSRNEKWSWNWNPGIVVMV